MKILNWTVVLVVWLKKAETNTKYIMHYLLSWKKIVRKLFILYEQKHSWCIMNNTFTHMNIWLQ